MVDLIEMKTIGLTGGIGSGKTTIARWFLAEGIPVYDSDSQAKELLHTDETLKEKIRQTFGENAYIDGIYNRSFIAAQVFEQPHLLQQLNEMVHPAVFDHFENWKKNQKSDFIVKEAAILFESGSYKDCDAIITVVADENIRLARVLQRDGLSEQQIRQRMQNQWTDAQRRELSDFIIENNGDMESLHHNFDRVFKALTQQFQTR